MTTRKPFISVVVPIYKVESYLRECIDSILAQTLSDIEVLLVDDGSPDGCGVICDEYAKKDARVRVFHKENGGVSMARKTGVDNATADWIAFVDGDDTLPRTALEDLYRERDGSDIIIGHFNEKRYDKEYLSAEENRSSAIMSGWGYIPCAPWARLIARHLFNEKTFTPREVVVSQDIIMNIRLAFANEKPVRLLSKKVYNYNNHSDSVSHSFVYSIDYEVLFYKHFIESIPLDQRERYAKECVITRLCRIDRIYNKQHRNLWHGTPYYKDLMACVKQCGYRIPLLWRIKLSITNTTLLRLYSMSVAFITYRYGLLKGKLLRKKDKR